MEEKKIQWLKAILGIIVLAPLFFIIYGWANTHTGTLPPADIGEIMYKWEKHIPFIPWTILPYWTIDLLYGFSLILPMTSFAFRQHYLRLLLATPIACGFFLLFPLTFSIPKPEITGVWKMPAELDNGILMLDKLIKDHGSVLVHCALGLSRSVTFIIGWLLYSKTVNSVDEALALLKAKKYPVHLSAEHLTLLTSWQKKVSTT